jgi:uncharacterized protein (TIGR00730 family)
MKRVAVYCGSSRGYNDAYAYAATMLGEAIARRGIGLVYGGAAVGLMGIVADAALALGGEVHGVIPRALATKELAHSKLTELYVVSSMHERKAKMSDLSDGFIAMPGGFGTLDELFEALTWAQLGFHQKPVGLYNVRGYYDPLVAFAEHAVREGFVSAEHCGMMLVTEDAEELLDRMNGYVPMACPKWITASET